MMVPFDHFDDAMTHAEARIHRVPVAGCSCGPCKNAVLAIWSRSLLAYCGAPPTPQEDTWR